MENIEEEEKWKWKFLFLHMQMRDRDGSPFNLGLGFWTIRAADSLQTGLRDSLGRHSKNPPARKYSYIQIGDWNELTSHTNSNTRDSSNSSETAVLTIIRRNIFIPKYLVWFWCVTVWCNSSKKKKKHRN